MNHLILKSCYDFTNGGNVFIGKTEELGFSGNSFSFMCWIKLNQASRSPSDQFDQTILGQRNYGMSECLHITVRNLTLHFGFYGMDTASQTTLSLHTWYHVAFVYDIEEHTQSIYINGKLDTKSAPTIQPLRGNHDLYYSHYANGRPLLGYLAAPVLTSQLVATQNDIQHHIYSYSIQHALSPSMLLPSGLAKLTNDPSWSPMKLSSFHNTTTTGTGTLGNDEFLKYFENEIGTDATVRCGSENIAVHKIIVAGRSKYFENVFFTSGMREQQDMVVVLDSSEFEADVLRLFLRALYTYKIESEYITNEDVLMHLLACTVRFGSDILREIIEQHAVNLVLTKIETVDILAVFAETFQLSKLYEVCLTVADFRQTFLA